MVVYLPIFPCACMKLMFQAATLTTTAFARRKRTGDGVSKTAGDDCGFRTKSSPTIDREKGGH